MKFETQLVHGRLIKRYKRFLADVVLDNGLIVTAHCTNTGTMKSCIEENADVFLTPVNDPKRKTKYTWEMIQINDSWVGINTGHPNKLICDAIQERQIDGLNMYDFVKREVKWEDCRFDIFAQNENEQCFIEVKNVSLKEGRYARFPDAVTIRGQKHLKTLIRVKEAGMRAVMCYVIQRTDVDVFSTADAIDPEYGAVLRSAVENGVEVFALQAKVTPYCIEIIKKLPIEL